MGSSASGGGSGWSLMAIVQAPPTWQSTQPAETNSARPWLTSDGFRPGRPGRLRRVLSTLYGLFGVRTASRIHSVIAVQAGIGWRPAPGSVTVSCGRPPLGLLKLFRMHGATLMSPLSPISIPWLGSSVPVAGAPAAGALQVTAATSGPGPETLRVFSSKSSGSSRIAE